MVNRGFALCLLVCVAHTHSSHACVEVFAEAASPAQSLAEIFAPLDSEKTFVYEKDGKKIVFVWSGETDPEARETDELLELLAARVRAAPEEERILYTKRFQNVVERQEVPDEGIKDLSSRYRFKKYSSTDYAMFVNGLPSVAMSATLAGYYLLVGLDGMPKLIVAVVVMVGGGILGRWGSDVLTQKMHKKREHDRANDAVWTQFDILIKSKKQEWQTLYIFVADPYEVLLEERLIDDEYEQLGSATEAFAHD